MGCQVAFAELCRGRPVDASNKLHQHRTTTGSSHRNAYIWLRSLIQFFCGREELARAGVESYLGSPLATDDDGNLSLATWLTARDRSGGELVRMQLLFSREFRMK